MNEQMNPTTFHEDAGHEGYGHYTVVASSICPSLGPTGQEAISPALSLTHTDTHKASGALLLISVLFSLDLIFPPYSLFRFNLFHLLVFTLYFILGQSFNLSSVEQISIVISVLQLRNRNPANFSD